MEQTKVFEAAEQFARIEGILPAPESSHAIRVAIDEALQVQGDRRGKDHRLRPDRHRLLRHGGLREVPQRQDDGLHPHRRGTGSQLRHAAQGARSGLKPPPTLTLSTHNRPAAPEFRCGWALFKIISSKNHPRRQLPAGMVCFSLRVAAKNPSYVRSGKVHCSWAVSDSFFSSSSSKTR